MLATISNGSILDDHFGQRFGEVAADGGPIVLKFPADLVALQPLIDPTFAH
jgi:hypothetical protein